MKIFYIGVIGLLLFITLIQLKIIKWPGTGVPKVVDCNYKLPPQYYLVKEMKSGKYAIKFMHIDVYTYYLYAKEFPFVSPYYDSMGESKQAFLFSDSCEAKGFAKTVIEESKPVEFVNVK